MVWTFVLPALIEKVVEFGPLLQLEYGFKLELDDLEVFRHDVSLRSAFEFVDAFCSRTAELLAMLAHFNVVLELSCEVSL